MRAADVVVEFVVTGAIGLLVVVLLVSPLGFPSDLGHLFSADPLSKGIAGVLALPAVYYLGIAVHHTSWRIWRKLFHRRRFAQIFKRKDASCTYLAMRDLAAKAYQAGGNAAGPDAEWEAKIEWCRFALMQYASEEARREYARQYHLYRATYGPLSVLMVAWVVAVVRAIVEPQFFWLAGALLVIVALLVDAAWHRAGRMWKSLCYSLHIAMEMDSQKLGPRTPAPNPPMQPTGSAGS